MPSANCYPFQPPFGVQHSLFHGPKTHTDDPSLTTSNIHLVHSLGCTWFLKRPGQLFSRSGCVLRPPLTIWSGRASNASHTISEKIPSPHPHTALKTAHAENGFSLAQGHPRHLKEAASMAEECGCPQIPLSWSYTCLYAELRHPLQCPKQTHRS